MSNPSRRTILKLTAAAAAAPVVAGSTATHAMGKAPSDIPIMSTDWPPASDHAVPNLCLYGSGNMDEAAARRLQQIGVTHITAGFGRMPWTAERIRAQIDRLAAIGIHQTHTYYGGMPSAIFGRPERDRDIELFIQSVRAAGEAGLEILEYDWYANRLMEGYIEELGRGGAGLTAYDYDLSKDLPPREDIGAHTKAELWANMEYFLKAVVPVAEEAGVRLAVHPNDPPVPLSRGSEQILATFEDWKHLVEVVPSPSNGITYDCGVCRELGKDPVEVCRWLGERDVINHVHFRNVIVRTPRTQYTEVFLDEGEVDLFNVMRELVRQKYPRLILPEHPRALDVDRENGINNQYPGGGDYSGFVYNVAYTRAMLQAALTLENMG